MKIQLRPDDNEKVQKLTDEFTKKVDEVVAEKSKEIMSI